MTSRLLIVEDEEGLVLSLEDRLRSEGYQVSSRSDGRSGEAEALRLAYDLIILDVMLPERDGFQVCRRLRRSGLRTPILMLTARGSTDDRVAGLRTGADDYLVKPFEMEELSARVHALLRRARDFVTGSADIQFGGFVLDTTRQELSRGDELVALNTTEYRLLEYLAASPGRVISRDELMDRVWGYGSGTSTRTVDVHVAWLRQKLEEQRSPRHIHTVRGRGYRFEP